MTSLSVHPLLAVSQEVNAEINRDVTTLQSIIPFSVTDFPKDPEIIKKRNLLIGRLESARAASLAACNFLNFQGPILERAGPIAVTMFGVGACDEVSHLALLKLAEKGVGSLLFDGKNKRTGDNHGWNIVVGKATDFVEAGKNYEKGVILDPFFSYVEDYSLSITTRKDKNLTVKYVEDYELRVGCQTSNLELLNDPKLLAALKEAAIKVHAIAKRLIEDSAEVKEFLARAEKDRTADNSWISRESVKLHKTCLEKFKAVLEGQGKELAKGGKTEAKEEVKGEKKEGTSKPKEKPSQPVDLVKLRENLTNKFKVHGASWKAYDPPKQFKVHGASSKASDPVRQLWIEGSHLDSMQTFVDHLEWD